jgi:hypothetical protein
MALFRVVFWDFTRQYIPEDNSEHHTRRRENLKSHIHYGHLHIKKKRLYI